MEKSKTTDKLIKSIFNEYSAFIRARFEESCEELQGRHSEQPELKFTSIDIEKINMLTPEEKRIFFMVSLYFVSILEDMINYIEEFHPGAYSCYISIKDMVDAVLDFEKEKLNIN